MASIKNGRHYKVIVICAYSVEVGDASQNPAIYDYAKTMKATGFKFYTQYPRVYKGSSLKRSSKSGEVLGSYYRTIC